MFSNRPASISRLVKSISLCEGKASPEGWKCVCSCCVCSLSLNFLHLEIISLPCEPTPFQRGLRPGSPSPATRNQPHRLPDHARDLRTCASTASLPTPPPPQSIKVRSCVPNPTPRRQVCLISSSALPPDRPSSRRPVVGLHSSRSETHTDVLLHAQHRP